MSKLICKHNLVCGMGIVFVTGMTWHQLSKAYVDDLETRLQRNNRDTSRITQWRQQNPLTQLFSIKNLKD